MRRGSSMMAALAVAGVAALAPLSAWALCPNCLGQNETLTPTLKLVGLFLLVPPTVAFFVARAIRRLPR